MSFERIVMVVSSCGSSWSGTSDSEPPSEPLCTSLPFLEGWFVDVHRQATGLVHPESVALPLRDSSGISPNSLLANERSQKEVAGARRFIASTASTTMR